MDRHERVLYQRYGLLLAALVALFLVQGIAPGGRWQEVVITALSAATLVLALRAGEVTWRIARLAGAAGAVLVAAVTVLAVNGTADTGAARIASGLLVAFAPPAIAVGVIRGLRARGATVQAVLGVLSCLPDDRHGLRVHVRRDRQPRRRALFAEDVAATTANCLYFSFTTLTTVGYGDVTTRTDLGHTLAVTEALFGQIYLVTVVALLV